MMDIPRLKICTLNCRGLGNDLTRQRLYHYLRTHIQADIICLQETHTPPQAAKFWTQVWAGPAVWSQHVGLLLHPSHTLLSSTFSKDKRIVQAEVSVRGCSFAVANMYAPATRPARLAFFHDLDLDMFDETTFLVGDWNCCPNPSQDRTSVPAQPDGWMSLAPSLTSFFDGALAGAASHYFTFNHSSVNYSARLDHVFVYSWALFG